MKAKAEKLNQNLSAKAVKPRVYYSGNFPIRAPVSPEVGEEIERKTEWYRLKTFAQQNAFIKNLCRKIAEGFKPDKIILFGSRAYGKPRLNSDIDLLVIMPCKGDPAFTAVRILNHLDMLVSIDLLVRTAEQVRKRIAMEDDFMQEVVEHGKVMYEANHA